MIDRLIKNEILILTVALVIALATFLLIQQPSSIPEQYPSIGFPFTAYLGDMNAEITAFQLLANLKQAFIYNTAFYFFVGNVVFLGHLKLRHVKIRFLGKEL